MQNTHEKKGSAATKHSQNGKLKIKLLHLCIAAHNGPYLLCHSESSFSAAFMSASQRFPRASAEQLRRK